MLTTLQNLEIEVKVPMSEAEFIQLHETTKMVSSWILHKELISNLKRSKRSYSLPKKEKKKKEEATKYIISVI